MLLILNTEDRSVLFSQEIGKVVCIPISLRIFHHLLWSTIKRFCVVNKAEVGIFLEFPCFFYDPVDVGNLISGSSTFLNPICTSGNSWFTYYWSLAWRILSTPCYHVKWAQLYGSLNIRWHYLSLRLEWKLSRVTIQIQNDYKFPSGNK